MVKIRSAGEKWKAVVGETCAIHATGRPVLIGTKSVAESQRIATELSTRNIRSKVLNGVQDDEEALVIASGGQPATVTVATDMADPYVCLRHAQDFARGRAPRLLPSVRRSRRRGRDRMDVNCAGRLCRPD